MAESTTARQRAFALALGVKFDMATSREELSDLIDDALRKPQARPSRLQKRLFKEWGLDPPEERTRDAHKDVLFEFMAVRAWANSVLRHMAGAKWRTYDESGFPAEAMDGIARSLVSNGHVWDQIEDHEKTDNVKGNVWFRIRKKTLETAGYQAVSEAIERDFGKQLQRTAKRVEREERASKSGCLVVVGIIAGLLLALL